MLKSANDLKVVASLYPSYCMGHIPHVLCNHLLKLQRFLEHPRAPGAIGISLKVCLQLEPRFGLKCEVSLFGDKYCVLSGSKRTWKPTTLVMPGEFTYLHLPSKKESDAVFAGMITPNSLDIWKKSKCLKSSYAYNKVDWQKIKLNFPKVDWQKKVAFPHFAFSSLSASALNLHCETRSPAVVPNGVVRSTETWQKHGGSGIPLRQAEALISSFSLRLSWRFWYVEKIRFLFVLTRITWNYG